MTVFVVIEYTGNSTVVDGAIVHGVHATHDSAEVYVAALSKRSRSYTYIEAHKVQGA